MTDITLKGIGVSQGAAVGSVFVFNPVKLDISNTPSLGTDLEQSRYLDAAQQAKIDLEKLRDNMGAQVGPDTANIFEAHISIVADPAMQEMVFDHIAQGNNAEQALALTAQHFADLFEAIDDDYFSARVSDVRDIEQRLLRLLKGVQAKGFEDILAPSIIVAHDLSPSETAAMQQDLVLALVTAAGGLTSHTAILARSLGIPAVVGVGTDLLTLAQKYTQLAVNGTDGSVVFNPSDETRVTIEDICRLQDEKMQKLILSAKAKIQTTDGISIHVMANVGGVSSTQDAVTYGADGIGLLRTEFLFLDQNSPPTETHQVAIYKQIFSSMKNQPIIIRTLDIGGDKPPSYLDFPDEQNPFLGWRAIRYCLDSPELFAEQIRAILRAAKGFDIRIMFPMISNLDELRRAKRIVNKARENLASEQIEHAENVAIGIMVETPAAALISYELALECDFISIGTNDLTQYTLAADRINERVASLYKPFHPAVLRLIRMTIESADKANIPVGMCGELASMKAAIPLLLGMGLREFSMSPIMIPEAKTLLSQLSFATTRDLANTVVSMATSDQVETHMTNFIQSLTQ